MPLLCVQTQRSAKATAVSPEVIEKGGHRLQKDVMLSKRAYTMNLFYTKPFKLTDNELHMVWDPALMLHTSQLIDLINFLTILSSVFKTYCTTTSNLSSVKDVAETIATEKVSTGHGAHAVPFGCRGDCGDE